MWDDSNGGDSASSFGGAQGDAGAGVQDARASAWIKNAVNATGGCGGGPSAAREEHAFAHRIWGAVERLSGDTPSRSSLHSNLEGPILDGITFHSGDKVTSSESVSSHVSFSSADERPPTFSADEMPVNSLEAHLAKKCWPCRFVYSKGGCKNAETCLWCHLEHQRRQRPSREKRAQCHRKLEELFGSNAPPLDDKIEEFASKSAYMNFLVHTRCGVGVKGADSEKGAKGARMGAGRGKGSASGSSPSGMQDQPYISPPSGMQDATLGSGTPWNGSIPLESTSWMDNQSMNWAPGGNAFTFAGPGTGERYPHKVSL